MYDILAFYFSLKIFVVFLFQILLLFSDYYTGLPAGMQCFCFFAIFKILTFMDTRELGNKKISHCQRI